jgi:hypothetical protein
MTKGQAINARATAGSQMVYMRESYKRIVSKDKAKADYLLACAEIEYSVALGVETVSL